MGKVGYRVTQELLRFGREVVGIELDPEARFVELVKAQGVPLLIANARRSEALDQAGIREADAIVPCTDDQLTNLDIALNSREANPSIKVVMRLYDSELARRVESGFGIHTAFSTSNLAAPSFAAAAMRFNVKYSFYVGDMLLVISEYCLPQNSSLIGWKVERLEDEYDLSVVRYQTRDLTDLHPDPDVVLEAGATLLLLADLETLRQLRPHLEP
jgi:Trk K+ transport system NAD-binding subunit